MLNMLTQIIRKAGAQLAPDTKTPLQYQLANGKRGWGGGGGGEEEKDRRRDCVFWVAQGTFSKKKFLLQALVLIC